MNIYKITPDYSVAPQLDPEALKEIAALGFVSVICNRPDIEAEAGQQSADHAAMAASLGLDFTYNPVTNGQLNQENLQCQSKALEEAKGPVLAYCRSGTRSTIVWSLVMAGRLSVEEIIGAAAEGGYNIEHMRPHIEALAHP